MFQCGHLLEPRNKIPLPEWLEQQKFILSQFWRLEVQDQGVGRFDFFSAVSRWLVDIHFLTVSSPGFSSVHGCCQCFFVCPNFLFL